MKSVAARLLHGPPRPNAEIETQRRGRIADVQRVGTEAERFDLARLEGFDDEVGLGRGAQGEFASGAVGEVGDGAALAGVQVLEERGAGDRIDRAARRRTAAQRITAGRLELDDVGARVAEQLRAIAAGDAGRQVDHAHAQRLDRVSRGGASGIVVGLLSPGMRAQHFVHRTLPRDRVAAAQRAGLRCQPMPVIEQTRTWAAVEERLATETDPILRRNLELVLAHMKAEAAGDLDGLLVTLADDAELPRLRRPAARAARRARPKCAGSTRTSSPPARPGLQLDIDRLIVDKHCILTEGVMRMAYPGSTLAARGIAVDDESAYYLYEARMATLWPFNDDGMIVGEDTYTGGNGFDGIADRKLAPEDIV